MTTRDTREAEPSTAPCDLCDKRVEYSFAPGDGTRPTERYCSEHVPPGLRVVVDRAVRGAGPRCAGP